MKQEEQVQFHSIEEGLRDLRQGKMIIVVDDEDRENEGDLLMAADCVTAEHINFMCTYGKGLICAPIMAERAQLLNLPPMVLDNTDHHQTAFTVSVDGFGTTTGISAEERAITIQALVDQETTASQLRRPGHIFPLVAKDGGVIERAGHTEAAVDLARLAGFQPAGVICEILKEDGTMARTAELMKFAQQHRLKIITIADLIHYRKQNEARIERIIDTKMPTKFGVFRIYGYEDRQNGQEHLALVQGVVSEEEDVLVRIHSECLTGDVLGSLRCDCGNQLHESMRRINEQGKGIILYMRQEGRGIGLLNKLKAYQLQDQGLDTVEANLALGFADDLREYEICSQMLADLGVASIELMTNNPRKIKALQDCGTRVNERVPIIFPHNQYNQCYLQVKQDKLGHMLNLNAEIN